MFESSKDKEQNLRARKNTLDEISIEMSFDGMKKKSK